jgi:YVTN family beta-propeller protein
VPKGIAYDFAKGEIFVANNWDSTVSVISEKDYSVVATVTVGVNPIGVAYDPILGEIFVTNQGSGTVSVISDSTNTVIATITVGAAPQGIAFDGKSKIFVTNSQGNTVSVISDKTNEVITTFSAGVNPIEIAYDSAKNEVYIVNGANNAPGTVSVVSIPNEEPPFSSYVPLLIIAVLVGIVAFVAVALIRKRTAQQ